MIWAGCLRRERVSIPGVPTSEKAVRGLAVARAEIQEGELADLGEVEQASAEPLLPGLRSAKLPRESRIERGEYTCWISLLLDHQSLANTPLVFTGCQTLWWLGHQASLGKDTESD